MNRRPPAKTRHRERPVSTRLPPHLPDDDVTIGPSTSLGAQVEESGYGSGHGTFGFTHHTIN